MRVYWTAKDVLVYSHESLALYFGRSWNMPCWRADTGKWHGWRPRRDLTELRTD